MLAIETENLHKSYDGLAVLRGLNLSVSTGQVYGMLGPNGAGKSTLIHLLLGFLKPSSGRLRVLGAADVEVVRSRVGYLPERLRYHLRYTAREYLRYLGQFNDLAGPRLRERIDQELRLVGLSEAADRMLSTYSKGMLQRLGIAQALLHDPDLLLIDEPTSGLDPAGQREMLDLLGSIRSRGHTIFLTTHFLDEVEHLCDRVGVLFHGRVATEVEVAELRAPGRNAVINVGPMEPDLTARLERLSPAVRCNNRQVLLQPNDPALQTEVLRTLLDAGVAIISIEPQGRPLEELYLRIVRGDGADLPRLPGTIGPDAAPAEELPNHLFAPPGHPDAAPEQGTPPASREALLRELLKRDNDDT